MLRLTRIPDGPAGTILEAEGRVVGAWVGLLESECRALAEAEGRVRLDLAKVSYLDLEGVRTLRTLAQGPVALINCPPLVEALLTEDEP